MKQTSARTRKRSLRIPILMVAAGALATSGCSNRATSPPTTGLDAAAATDALPSADAAAPEDLPPVDAADDAIEVPVDAAVPTPDLAPPADAPADAAPPPSDAVPVVEQTLFYLDVGGKVMSTDVAKPAAHTVVASAGKGPDGIAVDPVAGYIYWTTMGVPADNDGTVMRAKLDGTQVTTLVKQGDTYTPKQMKIDVATKKMYWSDREGMRVMRANLDGTQLETLVTVGTGDKARADSANWCVGIALDLPGGWFYWTQKGPDNGHMGSIRRAHVAMPAGQTSENRTDIEVLWSGLPEPIDMDLDVDAGLVYWTDRGDDTVNRGPIALPAGATAANRSDRQILVKNVKEAIGVVLDRSRGVLYYTSATGQLGRAGLDGTGNKELLSNAGAFTGIVVVDGP